MMRLIIAYFVLFLSVLATPVFAKDRLKLETTIIKGNKEMPQIVYIVPWKDTKNAHQKEQTLVLHSLFGNLFDPINMNSQYSKTK